MDDEERDLPLIASQEGTSSEPVDWTNTMSKKILAYSKIIMRHFLFRLKTKRLCVPSAMKIAYINGTARNYNRYLTNLVFYLTHQNYVVCLQHRFSALSGLAAYARFLADSPNVYFVFKRPNRVDLFLTSYPENPPAMHPITIDKNVFSKRVNPTTSVHIPLGMHPCMYRNGYYAESESLMQRGDRPIKIIFAGNIESEIYSNKVIGLAFGKLSRAEVIQTILKELSPGQLSIPASQVEMEDILSTRRNKFVLVDTGRFSIEKKNWLSTLSKCDFFLSPPGVFMPLCHNTFEAMSVGSIPILEHSELHYPRLEHGKNCIAYSGKADLLAKVKEVLVMSAEAISQMRGAVIDYYQANCSPSAVVMELEKRRHTAERILLNAEKYSVSQFLDESGIRDCSVLLWPDSPDNKELGKI